jgi:hypothetical protein
LNYYGPVFILYELSTPFLNIHWFCDKLNMTGGKLQWYNGIILLSVFFGCRLIWGTWNSLRVYQDVWHAMHLDTQGGPVLREISSTIGANIFAARNGELCLGDKSCVIAQSEVMKFTSSSTTQAIPLWLALIYLSCNVVLNCLNFYWFGKMIETVRKRFDGSNVKANEDGSLRNVDGRRRMTLVEHAATELDYDTLSGPKTPFEEKSEQSFAADGDATSTGRDGDGEVKSRAARAG